MREGDGPAYARAPLPPARVPETTTMGDFIRSKMARKASSDPARATVRDDLVTARRRLYAAAKACDAAMKMETDAMTEAARPLVAAARLLPDA